jgi:hypothetical protein
LLVTSPLIATAHNTSLSLLRILSLIGFIPSATLDRHFHNRYRHFHTEKSLRTRNSGALIGYYSLQRKSNLPKEESG